MSFYYDINTNDNRDMFMLYNQLYNSTDYFVNYWKEEDEKMSRDYNDIVDLYSNKEIDNIKAERDTKIRETLLKDDVAEYIVNLLRGREKELELEKDTLINKFCNNEILMEIVPEKIRNLCNKEYECYKEKMKEHNEKIKEVKAILKMTETWAEMKEVLMKYGIIDWDEK